MMVLFVKCNFFLDHFVAFSPLSFDEGREFLNSLYNLVNGLQLSTVTYIFTPFNKLIMHGIFSTSLGLVGRRIRGLKTNPPASVYFTSKKVPLSSKIIHAISIIYLSLVRFFLS